MLRASPEGRLISLKVGELYATMRLDDAEFNQGVDGSKSRFEGLRNVVGSGVKVMATAFAATTTAVAGLGIAAFKVGLDYNRLQQSSRAALTTLLGSAEAANAQMDKLDDFASNSPFAKQVFIEAQQQLIGFGMAADDVLPTLDAIQNAVAAVGGSNEDISEVTRVLAVVQSSGKITAETLNQLGARGIDAATLIGESMGMTGAEIRDSITAGSLDAEDAIAALTDGMMERFGGATDNIKEQMDGAADRIKGAFRDIGSVLAAPFVDPKGGGMLVVWTNEVADAMRAFQGKLTPLVDLLVDRFGPGLATVSPLLQTVKEVLNSWDISKVNSQLDALGQYTPIIAGVSTAMFALGTSSLPIIGGINPLVAGFAALAATSPDVRQMLSDFAGSLSPLLPVLGDFSVLLADTAMLVLRELTPALADLLVAGGDVAVAFGTTLVPILGDLLVAGMPLVDVLGDVLRYVADLPQPVQIAAAAFLLLRSPLSTMAPMIAGVADGFARFRDTARLQASLGGVSTATGGLATATSRAAGGLRGMAGAMAGMLFNPVVIGVAAVAGALAIFISRSQEAAQKAATYRDTLDEVGNATEDTAQQIERAVTDVTNANFLESIFGSGESILDRADKLGVAVQDVIGYINGEADAIERVNAATAEYVEANSSSRRERGYASESVNRFMGMLDDESTALQRGKDAVEALAGSHRGAAGEVESHREAQERLARELEDGIDATLSAAEAALRMEDSMARAAEAVDRKREADAELERVLADSTATEEERTAAQRAAEQATRDAERAVIDVVKTTNDNIAAIDRNNGSYEQMRAEMQRARDAFIEQRIQLGDTAAEARKLADDYGLIPSRVDTMVHLSGVQAALDAIGSLDRTLNTINGKTVTANVAVRQYGQAAIASGGYVGDFAAALGYAGGGSPKRFPHGGQALGPGTGTSDEIAAWLSNTEFVTRAASVQKYGLPFMHAVNQGRFPVELARPFAVGGSPSSPAPAAAAGLAGVRVSLAGTHVVLRVGEREIVGYLEEVADGRVSEAARRQKASWS